MGLEVSRRAYSTPENDSREILTQVLMFDLAGVDGAA